MSMCYSASGTSARLEYTLRRPIYASPAPPPPPPWLTRGPSICFRFARSPGGGLVGRIAIVLGSIAACAACLQYLPEPLWGLLVVVSTPTIIAVQAPQIIKNFRQKHTGELAVLTVVLSFVGSCIRVGTTIAVGFIWPFVSESGEPEKTTRGVLKMLDFISGLCKYERKLYVVRSEQ